LPFLVEHWLVVEVRVEDGSTTEAVVVGLSVVEQHLDEDGFNGEAVGVGVKDGCVIEVDTKRLPVEDGSPIAGVHLSAPCASITAAMRDSIFLKAWSRTE
jgi:hypothetical protein